jgi:hypothetical protein
VRRLAVPVRLSTGVSLRRTSQIAPRALVRPRAPCNTATARRCRPGRLAPAAMKTASLSPRELMTVMPWSPRAAQMASSVVPG